MWNDKKMYYQFLRNASATCQNRNMAIDINSVCAVGCKFCFNNNDLPGVVRRIPTISEEDLDMALHLANPYMSKNIIQLGSGDKIWWGDPMAHPQFTHFVRRISSVYPETEVHFDTSGYYATPEIVDELKQISNIRIFLSVNTLDPDVRINFFRQPGTAGLELMLRELPIHYAFLKFFGNIPVVLKDLETLLNNKNVKYICLYKLHYTQYNRQEDKALIESTRANFYEALEAIYKHYPDIDLRAECQWLDNPLDQRSALYKGHVDFLDKLVQYVKNENPSGDFVICTGESAYNYLCAKTGSEHVVMVKNNSYSGTITSSGMLTLQDIKDAILASPVKQGWSCYVPSEIMDERGYDRLEISFVKLAEEFAQKKILLKDPKLLTYVY